LGTLQVDFGAQPRPLGGSQSPFQLGGTFSLQRAIPAGQSIPVATLSTKNATLSWKSVGNLNIPLLQIATNGFINAQVDPLNLSLPGMSIKFGAISLLIDAGALNARLSMGSCSLSIAGIVPAASPLIVPSFTVGISDSFSIPLVTANQLTLGSLSINGSLVFERSAGVFQLAVRSPSAGVLPQLVIPNFATIALHSFAI